MKLQWTEGKAGPRGPKYTGQTVGTLHVAEVTTFRSPAGQRWLALHSAHMKTPGGASSSTVWAGSAKASQEEAVEELRSYVEPSLFKPEAAGTTPTSPSAPTASGSPARPSST